MQLAILDAMGEDRDELSAPMAEMFDEDVLGEELFGLVQENDEHVKAEDGERALEEADVVAFEEPLEEEPPPPALSPPTWSNMQKEEATSGMCWEAETARAEKARAARQASKKRRMAGMMSATLIW